MILLKARPTPAQADAGNYTMKRRSFRGLQISVENPAGSVREGADRGGKKWRTKMTFDYGYIRRTEGVDGDHVDCYIGPDEDAPNVYVVHQRKAGDWKVFDEDKAMLGFPNKEAAVRAYLAHYDDKRFLGPVTTMPFDAFKAKALATKGDPGMIKSLVLFAKAHVKAHVRRLRSGKVAQVLPYERRGEPARAASAGHAATAPTAEGNGGTPDMPSSIVVDGVARPTRNSEGKPIATTQAALAAFWRWFGDSRVVDADGRPRVVYHGTTANFDAFTLPAYFSTEPSEASAYTFSHVLQERSARLASPRYRVKKGAAELAGTRVPYYGIISDAKEAEPAGTVVATDQGVVRIGSVTDVFDDLVVVYGDAADDHKTIMIKKGNGRQAARTLLRDERDFIDRRTPPGVGVGGNVVPVYLSIRNPKEMHALHANRYGARLGGDSSLWGTMAASLREQGFDGIVTNSDEAAVFADTGVPSSEHWLPIRADQIKSAVGNGGAYSTGGQGIVKSVPAVLFFKSYVRAHTRRGKNGKVISVGSYHTDVTAAPAPVRRGNDTKTGDLFGSDKPVDRSRAAERGLTADNDMRSAKQKAYEAEHGPEERAYSRRLPNGKWMPGDKDGPIAGAPEFDEMTDAYHFARRALETRGRSHGGASEAPERIVKVPAGTTAVGHVDAFEAARREAGKMARDAVVRVRVEREQIYSDSPPVVDYGAFVSEGDGTAIYVSANFPASKARPSDAEIKNMVAAYRAKAAGQDAKVSAVKAKRLADIKAKGIVVGAQWKGAQAYVAGRKGLATFSNARVVSIGQDGIITVKASMRGSQREWVLKVEPDSRLFDSYPGRPQD